MLCSPLSAAWSGTCLPLYCLESLTSRALFEGFIPDISDWEAPNVLRPMMHKAMLLPLDKFEAADPLN